MSKNRLLLRKEGRAKYISHLDLMHTMQRVFLRAGVGLRHTEGFNPHPYLSFALPLSVGCESICELMDFDLVEELPLNRLPGILNSVIPEGITVVSAYEPDKKFAGITWLEVEGRLFYDCQIPAGTLDELRCLFDSDSIVISKRTKKGMTDFNVIPCINKISFSEQSSGELLLDAVISAQNPSLNPENLMTAIRQEMPSYSPDFAAFRRIEVYDDKMRVFR